MPARDASPSDVSVFPLSLRLAALNFGSFSCNATLAISPCRRWRRKVVGSDLTIAPPKSLILGCEAERQERGR
jgi:hypothetical protein